MSFSPLAAAVTGVPFVLRRPATVLAWAVLQFAILLPTVAFFAFAASGEADTAGGWFPLAYLAGGLVLLVLQIMAYTAAVRSLLKPEASRFAYLRFGDAERNHFSVGSAGGADTGEAPLSRTAILAAIILLPVVAVAFAPLGWWTLLLWPAALFPAVAYGVYVSIRSSLTSAVAFYRWDARRAAWRMSKGQVLPLLLMHATALLIWGIVAAAVVGACAYALASVWDLPVVEVPGALWSQVEPRRWLDVFAPLPLAVVGVASLLAALRLALCARPSAAAYKALALDNRTSRTLAERVEG